MKTDKVQNLGPLAIWLERAIVAAMFLFVAAAPNSIAAAQTAWMLGMLFWLLRFFVWPRPKLDRTPIDYPMFAFFLLTALSAFLSYEPSVSIGKLRAASLFLIIYLFAENVRSQRILTMLTVILIAATMVNVVFTFGQIAIGRGVKVYGVALNSPLGAARMVSRSKNDSVPIISGDTIEKIDGRSLGSLDELVTALNQSPDRPAAKCRLYGLNGLASWKCRAEVTSGRDGRKTRHSALGFRRDRRATGFTTTGPPTRKACTDWIAGARLVRRLARKRSRNGLLMGSLPAFVEPLLRLRARPGFRFISALLIAALGCDAGLYCDWRLPDSGNLGGLFLLQQKRQVGFFDKKDDSIAWRQKIWARDFICWLATRHLAVGIGMDSMKAHWREWGLFEGGKPDGPCTLTICRSRWTAACPH